MQLRYSPFASRLAGLVCNVALVASAAGQEEGDLQAITDAVVRYHSQIDTLAGEFTCRIERAPDANVTPATMENWMAERTFVMDAKRGWQSVEETSMWWHRHISATDPFSVRKLQAFDGTTRHTLLYTPRKSPIDSKVPTDVPHQLTHSGGNDIDDGPWTLAGLRLRNGISLVHLMKAETGKLEGRETTDGSESYRLVFPQRRYTVWLDPARDYLPRRQMQELRPGEIEYACTITEFATFLNPTTGRVQWFPSKGTIETATNGTRLIDVLDLRLNEPVTQAEFQIDPASLPDGVKVIPNDGSKVWVTGDRWDLFEERSQQMDESMEAYDRLLKVAEAKLTLSNAAEQQRSDGLFAWWQWGILGGSLLFVMIAAVRVARWRRY